MSDWRSLENPPRDMKILICKMSGEHLDFMYVAELRHNKWLLIDAPRRYRSVYLETQPTHWMPLPTTPNTKEKAK